jgi:DNA mismatch repair protein MutL
MADHIQLLPDSIANQIAAGEVVQRPASVVKELMENAIDAKATEIKLIVRNAGKTLIQVIDNGKGMSELDARMCFERHATSKIRTANDLFSISTMGFRGEALASISAVAKVELITRTTYAEMATKIKVEGSEYVSQEPCAHPVGTSVSVKNLFYKVPARLKFLKSDLTEFKHILDEFNRIVLAYPEVQFSLYHNDQENQRLKSGNSRQRLVTLFGKTMNEKLVPVSEEIDELFVEGFITKPEAAKKTREQFLFVNDRFIKSPYLNHAIRSAYEELIPKDQYPPFFLFLKINPAKVDVNVHPTKQEVKFEEERLIYNYIKVAVRHALGKYNITPSLDFETQNDVLGSLGSRGSSGNFGQSFQMDPRQRQNMENWDKIYEGMITVEHEDQPEKITIPSQFKLPSEEEDSMFSDSSKQTVPYQLHNAYILLPIKSGLMVIDQYYASERIEFELVLDQINSGKRSVQRRLFPETIELSNTQYEIFTGIQSHLNDIGFELEDFGQQTIILHGIPSHVDTSIDVTAFIFQLIDDFGRERENDNVLNEKLARAMAKNLAIRKGKALSMEEMQDLVDKLFACSMPFKTPTGKNCFISIENDELIKRMNR